MVCHYTAKFSDHKHCDSRDLMFLICNVASCQHVLFFYIKGYVKSIMVSHHLTMFLGA